MGGDLVHQALAAVGRGESVRLPRVAARVGEREIAGFLRAVPVVACDQSDAVPAVVRAVEPFAGERRLLGLCVVAIPLRVAEADEVVLRETVLLDAETGLDVAAREAAVRRAHIAVVAAGAGRDVRTAGNGMKAVPRIVRAAHDLDAGDVRREDHVEVRHVPVVAVGRDPVDQQLDRVDLALAVEAAQRELAGRRPLAELRDHRPRKAVEELPAVVHVRVGDEAAAEHVDGGEDVLRRDGSAGLSADEDFADDERRAGLRGFRGVAGGSTREDDRGAEATGDGTGHDGLRIDRS